MQCTDPEPRLFVNKYYEGIYHKTKNRVSHKFDGTVLCSLHVQLAYSAGSGATVCSLGCSSTLGTQLTQGPVSRGANHPNETHELFIRKRNCLILLMPLCALGSHKDAAVILMTKMLHTDFCF